MSAPASTPQDSVSTTSRPCPFTRYVKPLLTPYYLTVAAVLGAVTAIFGLLVVVLLIIATNFNVLGLIE